MKLFRHIKKRWRVWRVRNLLKMNTRAILQNNDEIRAARAARRNFDKLRKRSIELTNQRLRIEREARLFDRDFR